MDVRHRIQKTLEISDKVSDLYFQNSKTFQDFAKWKMALVQNSQAKYYSELNDHETVATNQFYVQTRDGAPLVQHRVWIGLGENQSQSDFEFTSFFRPSKSAETPPTETCLYREADKNSQLMSFGGWQ